MQTTDLDNTGWIKLHRKLFNWEWYTDIPVKVLFIHLILKANHSPQRWRGIEIERGELVTSTEHLSLETGLSIQQVKTALKKLIKSGEVTKSATKSFSLIKVVNYSIYQAYANSEQPTNNQQLTNNQPTANQRLTTNKNDKNYNNKKNEKKKQRLKCEIGFDIDEIKRKAMLNEDYDI